MSLESAKRFWDSYRRSKRGVIGLILVTLFLIIAVFAAYIAPYDPTKQFGQAAILLSPSSVHPLGTDEISRDILSSIMYAARISLLVGFLAAFISLVIGTIIGVTSGYYGGSVGEVLMRATDLFLVIPFLPFVMVLTVVLGSTSIWNIIFVIGITGWTWSARTIRSEAISLKERSFVERAKSIGATDSHIMVQHILPNVLPLAFANSVILIGNAILTESILAFLGLGDPTHVSWGLMLSFAFSSGSMTLGAWWYVLPPGICIVLVILGFTFVGNALEDTFSPRRKTSWI
jgi:peptide/nickel transport system permease protein